MIRILNSPGRLIPFSILLLLGLSAILPFNGYGLVATACMTLGLVLSVSVSSIQRQGKELIRVRGLLADSLKTQALLRTMIDSTPDLMFIQDREHRYQVVNGAFAKRSTRRPE